MRSSDLEQVSKFSLVQNLKLFLLHPKDLESRKNVLGRNVIFKKRTFLFAHPLNARCDNHHIIFYLSMGLVTFWLYDIQSLISLLTRPEGETCSYVFDSMCLIKVFQTNLQQYQEIYDLHKNFAILDYLFIMW